MNAHPRILVSTDDLERLQRLIEQNQDGRNAPQADLLEQELLRAEALPPERMPAGVVRMNSTVLFEDEETHVRRQVTLCYPAESRGEDGRVSVLAPVGSALLGLSVGQSIEWPVPGGRRRLRIVAVPRPEATEAVSSP
jgi:regulator of nucleoside diphosphate kinase